MVRAKEALDVKRIESIELFHRIADKGSAKARKALSSLDMVSLVKFRNVGTSSEAEQALKLLSPGLEVPTLKVVFIDQVGARSEVVAVGEGEVLKQVGELQ